MTNKPYGPNTNGRIPLEHRLATAPMASTEGVRHG
jgi:hypothetical protein